MSILLIWIFDAETTKLIQLYIVGVFVSFNLSQLGMIRHWTRHLKTEHDPAARRRMMRSRAINTFGLGHDRRRAGDRADHQVPRRRLDHDPRDGVLLHAHEGASAATTRGSSSSSRPTSRTRSCRPACTRSCSPPSCTSRPCAPSPSPGPPAPTCSRRSTSASTPRPPTGCWRSGTSATSTSRSRCCTRPTARSCGRSSSTPRRSAAPARAASSRSTSRSTSSGAGGSSCCTTRPRCGSRAACSSPPASWSSRCPTSCGPPRSPQEREQRDEVRVHAGDLRRGRVSRAPSDRSTTYRAVDRVSRTNRPRKARGRSRVGERFEVEVGPGRPRRSLRRPAARAGVPRRVRAARAAGRAGGRRDHRGHRRRPVLARRRRLGARRPRPTGSRPPCPVAGPGLCGGCDFQHVAAARPARPQDRRGARAARPPRPARRGSDLVTGLAGRGRARSTGRADDGLRWRTRQRYAVAPGRAAGHARPPLARPGRPSTTA